MSSSAISVRRPSMYSPFVSSRRSRVFPSWPSSVCSTRASDPFSRNTSAAYFPHSFWSRLVWVIARSCSVAAKSCPDLASRNCITWMRSF